jgi:hypothetical protein
MRLGLAALSLALVAPASAFAADRMFSYDPVSADAKRLTGRGLTFIFDQGVMRTRAKRILATAVSAQAELKPVGEGVLGKGGRAVLIKDGAAPFEGELYEVDPDKAQGRVYARAWCPGGSTRLWVAIGRFGCPRAAPVWPSTRPGRSRSGFFAGPRQPSAILHLCNHWARASPETAAGLRFDRSRRS